MKEYGLVEITSDYLGSSLVAAIDEMDKRLAQSDENAEFWQYIRDTSRQELIAKFGFDYDEM